MQETGVQSLGLEDPLEKEMAIHSSTIAWKIPWTEEPGRLQSMGSQRVRHDWATSLHSFLYSPALTSVHDYWKNHSLVDKVMSLLFNVLSRLVIAFLPRSKRLLISQLQSPSAVILEPQKINSVTVSIVSPSICHEVMRPDAMIFVFWMFWILSQLFHSSFSLSSRGSLVLHFLP